MKPRNTPAFIESPKRDSVAPSDAVAAEFVGDSGGSSRSEFGAIFGIQPTASRLKERLLGAGAGGSLCAAGLVKIVMPHYPIKRTTITVVTYMIFRASSE